MEAESLGPIGPAAEYGWRTSTTSFEQKGVIVLYSIPAEIMHVLVCIVRTYGGTS